MCPLSGRKTMGTRAITSHRRRSWNSSNIGTTTTTTSAHDVRDTRHRRRRTATAPNTNTPNSDRGVQPIEITADRRDTRSYWLSAVTSVFWGGGAEGYINIGTLVYERLFMVLVELDGHTSRSMIVPFFFFYHYVPVSRQTGIASRKLLISLDLRD